MPNGLAYFTVDRRHQLYLDEQVDTLKCFTFADEIMALSADRGSLWLRRRAQ